MMLRVIIAALIISLSPVALSADPADGIIANLKQTASNCWHIGYLSADPMEPGVEIAKGRKVCFVQ